MDYVTDRNNLSEYVKSLAGRYADNISDNSIETLMLDTARDLKLDIVNIDDSCYIKKGEKPKALLHLNIDYYKNNLSFSMEDDNIEIIKSEYGINLITSSILICYLLNFSHESFDVLITHNNINMCDKKYNAVANILRTDNVINLNLRQANCIADEFSSLKLFLNQVKVERFKPTYEFGSYRISLHDLSGGHAGEEADKVKLNSIKLLVTIIRKIKAKVDIDIVSLVGGERYEYIPSTAHIDFVVDSQYEADLLNIFDIVKNESLEKNLKYEPDMKLSLTKIDTKKKDPITKESFNYLASFIELIPLGSFFVNSIDDKTISSSNLATARSLKNHVNLIIVLRSLSEESMNSMIERINVASSISNSILNEKFHIDKWKNKDTYLTDVFKTSYSEINNDELNVVKTQYSLDSSIIFNDLNVKIISIGVKYKKADNVYYSSIEDLFLVVNLLEKVLNKIY